MENGIKKRSTEVLKNIMKIKTTNKTIEFIGDTTGGKLEDTTFPIMTINDTCKWNEEDYMKALKGLKEESEKKRNT